ncbi:hypothetical protein LY78DRAFT_662197 [Colletotrichum sublineola]|nr:hypothetical protein LY78DRAFT_662197 [Colletotrichum sublineola]
MVSFAFKAMIVSSRAHRFLPTEIVGYRFYFPLWMFLSETAGQSLKEMNKLFISKS